MSKSLFSYFTKTTSDKARYDGNESAKESCIVSHGDIVWAKLDNFPWWPGMICDDPKVKSLQMTVGGKRNFHVQFFGKPPTHDWVNERFVHPFLILFYWDSHSQLTRCRCEIWLWGISKQITNSFTYVHIFMFVCVWLAICVWS